MERAREYARLSAAAFSVGRWQEAISCALRCRELAEPGTALYAWTANQLACIYTDIGRVTAARTWARTYLRESQGIEGLERATAFTVRVLGLLDIQQRRFARAASHLRRAIALFDSLGDIAQVDRTRLALVWALAYGGRSREARAELSRLDGCHDSPLYTGAVVAVLASEGRWAEVIRVGRQALQGHRAAYDAVDAAEICLLIAKGLRCLGNRASASAFIQRAARLARLQERRLEALAALSNGVKGGETPYAALGYRGSRNPWDACSFTSGVA